jgi:hypothetical protein
MSAFDELTLGDVDELRSVCLGGKNINDPTIDPLTLAGAVMWATQRQDDPGNTWEAFKAKTKMGDIKAFSVRMQAEEEQDTANP